MESPTLTSHNRTPQAQAASRQALRNLTDIQRENAELRTRLREMDSLREQHSLARHETDALREDLARERAVADMLREDLSEREKSMRTVGFWIGLG